MLGRHSRWRLPHVRAGHVLMVVHFLLSAADQTKEKKGCDGSQAAHLSQSACAISRSATMCMAAFSDDRAAEVLGRATRLTESNTSGDSATGAAATTRSGMMLFGVVVAKQAWTRADEDTAKVGYSLRMAMVAARAAERRVACSGRAQRATIVRRQGELLWRKGSGKW